MGAPRRSKTFGRVSTTIRQRPTQGEHQTGPFFDVVQSVFVEVGSKNDEPAEFEAGSSAMEDTTFERSLKYEICPVVTSTVNDVSMGRNV